MAPGLILRISVICILLSGSSAVSPANKVPAMHNFGDDDEAWFSDLVAPSNWRASQDTPPVPVPTNRPSAPYRPVTFPPPKNLPDAPRSAETVMLVNGRPRDWSRENPDTSLLFPLSPNFQTSDPGRPQPGRVVKYPSENTGPSWHAAPPTGDDDDNDDYDNNVSKGSSPSPAPQSGPLASSPALGPVGPIYPVALGRPSAGLSGGERPGFSQTPNLPQKPVAVTQAASEPLPPPSGISPRVIVQSRNGYERASYLQSKSRYSPQVHPVSSTHVWGEPRAEVPSKAEW
ncbi:uncharacterized protein LOC119220223 [Pungitius pungitius]|uniref:uncharacterized protein LOC119220223 n=1 Tax=Pungitius pungitius TaxID=134920 RepID=UPI002E148DB4